MTKDKGTIVKEIAKGRKSIPGEIDLTLLEPCIQCGHDDPTLTISYSNTSSVKADFTITCNYCGNTCKLEGVTFCKVRTYWNTTLEKIYSFTVSNLNEYIDDLHKDIKNFIVSKLNIIKESYFTINRQGEITSISCTIKNLPNKAITVHNDKFNSLTNIQMFEKFISLYKNFEGDIMHE